MTFRRPVVAVAFLVGLLALAVVPPCRAAEPDNARQQSSYGRGTDAFRRLLFELRFQPLRSFAELEDNSGESLFIMLGNPECLSSRYFQQEGLRSFVEKGGAVLIATDSETAGEADNVLRDLAGVTVTGETLACTYHENAKEFYNKEPYCPFVQPIATETARNEENNILWRIAAALRAAGRPALFRNPHPDSGELNVATNAPSRLRVEDRGLRWGMYRLAYLPINCKVEIARHQFEFVHPRTEKKVVEVSPELGELEIVGNGIVGENLRMRGGPRVAEPPLFAVGGIAGKGRVLVLADHSIFINRMILPPELGNLEFAANCLHWLRGGVSSPLEALRAVNSPDALRQLAGQRTKVLLWDDGSVNTTFEVPLKKISVPPPNISEPAVVAAVDQTLAKLEDSNFFNRKIREALASTPEGFPGVLRGGVYLLTVVAGLLLGYLFLWRIRYQWEPAFPSLAETIQRHQPTLSVLDQRRRAQLRSGNVWEMGHRLAREYFESAGVALTTASPPRMRLTHGSWRQHWRARRRLARLWRLARGDAPFSLSPAALKKRVRELEELKTALASGTIVLDAECGINHG